MNAKPKNSRTNAIPVRLDKSMREAVRSAAGKAKTTASALIRFAIINQLDEMSRTGELRVPANYQP